MISKLEDQLGLEKLLRDVKSTTDSVNVTLKSAILSGIGKAVLWCGDSLHEACAELDSFCGIEIPVTGSGS